MESSPSVRAAVAADIGWILDVLEANRSANAIDNLSGPVRHAWTPAHSDVVSAVSKRSIIIAHVFEGTKNAISKLKLHV
jgi:hypothetical protein